MASILNMIMFPGSEIKEDLMKALQNRLDDATLDVISLAFVRNSKCKLTLEDVQFIQRPGEVPKSVIHFTVQVRILPFLEVVIYYLCQELMSFLNIPFYVDPRPENQFQCFKKVRHSLYHSRINDSFETYDITNCIIEHPRKLANLFLRCKKCLQHSYT